MLITGNIINAFTDSGFNGNPAAVVNLENWPDDSILLSIAKKNQLPETAFYCPNDSKLTLRWFTPDIEMDLCGHATLATSYFLKNILKEEKSIFKFKTKSGEIIVFVDHDLFALTLPSRKGVFSTLPDEIRKALNILPIQVLKSRDYLLIYRNQNEIENIKINRSFFDQINLDPGGVIVSAKGDEADFISRFFTPQSTILEDPVTGSAHCTLVPYWADILKKDQLLAFQLSPQKGKLICQNLESSVIIKGKATFIESFIFDI
jgi:PhzF family phenazine biosynthesis protein